MSKRILLCDDELHILRAAEFKFKRAGYDVVTPEGAFYLFFTVEGEDDSMALAKRLVDETNVGLAPGTAFGPGGERFLRLCFACSLERLGEALDRLEPTLGR